MINPFKDTNWNPDLAARRSFGKSFVIGFPIIAAIFLLVIRWNSGRWAEWPLWLGGIGAGLGLVFWAVPQIARPAYLAWYFLACCIGILISNLIVAVVYYLAITPVGLLLRLFGKDPMQRKFDPASETYWLDAEKVTDPQRYFRQF
jgi:hypothetical protein